MRKESSQMVYTPAGNAVNFIPNKAVAVTPHDTDTFQAGILYVGGLGDIKCLLEGDTAYVTFVGVPAGSMLPIYVKGVHTDTTASNILVLY